MAPRGNKGYFHGEPLSFLNDSLPHYLSIAPTKKETFWSKFFPEWDTKYPKLDSEELREELEEEERLHKAESEYMKAANQEEAKRHSCHKAILEAYPAMSKLKGWFSNAKTKEKPRKIEPFRTWLASLTALRGSPRHIQMPWMSWQHPTHGEVLRAHYWAEFGKDADNKEEDVIDRLNGFEKEDSGATDEDTPHQAQTLYRKQRLALMYFDELGEEEQAHMQAEREKDFVVHRNTYKKTLKGKTECSEEELAE
ncbi:hypothetical protein DFH08DRAFT_813283 [Mycena albidolilacea]|uniref:Uncharacterized protein n=1 Tax=Mycena albidolilacea TaxID=1033008 RepID=A0AAD7ELE7_9AGAR|nr:hypothetical protein DFH08DRAFT_813283 [Mycena albidolilacea]